MMDPKHSRVLASALLAWLVTATLSAQQSGDPQASSAALHLVGSLPRPVRDLAAEVLARNPDLQALEARARASRHQAPQAGSLPDPVLGMTAFVAPPETRVGPQRFMTTLSQQVPWKGKLAAKERAALYHARALEARVEARRLELVTRVRRLVWELGFLSAHEHIIQGFRGHLLQHEEIARVRYSTGAGLGQGVVKIQAEITGVDNQLVALADRRVRLVAELNELRDEPASVPIGSIDLGPVAASAPDAVRLVSSALALRPELDALDAEIARAQALVELAEKGTKPDFTIGLSYTAVDGREDAPGRLNPPPDDGDDVFGLQGGIVLPVRRQRIRSALAEARELSEAAIRAKRSMEARIRRTVGDLAQRIPLQWRQLRLLDDLLIFQADESLQSAQAAYVTGRLNALDLLDAEHVLFNARTSVARAHADYLIAIAELEGAVGEPLPEAAPAGNLGATP